MTRPRLRLPSPAMVVALIALMVALGGTTYAATGGDFLLGKANTATKVSTLTNSSGAALKLASGGTGSPLALTAPSGVAPLTVNSTTKVTHLNADLLDGTKAASLTTTFLGSGEFSGPLPHSTSDPITTTGNLMLVMVSGSAYRAAADGAGYLDLAVVACPGNVVGCSSGTSGALVLNDHETFSNEVDSHKPISWVFASSIPAGTYTMAVDTLGTGTTTDSSDEFDVEFLSLG